MADPETQIPHRPGAVSLFFVVKAGVFAACFWAWLVVLAATTDFVSGVQLVVASGAITTTVVAVILGARMALQCDAARRHAELKRLLVDISWNAFAAAGNGEGPAKVMPFPAPREAPAAARSLSEAADGDHRGSSAARS